MECAGRWAIETPIVANVKRTFARKLTLRGNLLYRRHFLPAAERAGLQVEGLPNVRFHDLRHTYAALLIALNAPPKAIQNWMGHSSISVTFDVYGHLFPFAEDEVTARLDALMSE